MNTITMKKMCGQFVLQLSLFLGLLAGASAQNLADLKHLFFSTTAAKPGARVISTRMICIYCGITTGRISTGQDMAMCRPELCRWKVMIRSSRRIY